MIMTLMFILASCGPNKEVLRDTKLEGALKDQMAILDQEGAEEQELTIVGVCDTTVNGAMRAAILGKGGQVTAMKGNEFTAKVPSSSVFNIADLEFVRSLRLKDKK
jgi:hypothetical protein